MGGFSIDELIFYPDLFLYIAVTSDVEALKDENGHAHALFFVKQLLLLFTETDLAIILLSASTS